MVSCKNDAYGHAQTLRQLRRFDKPDRPDYPEPVALRHLACHNATGLTVLCIEGPVNERLVVAAMRAKVALYCNHAFGIGSQGFSEGAYCPLPEARASV